MKESTRIVFELYLIVVGAILVFALPIFLIAKCSEAQESCQVIDYGGGMVSIQCSDGSAGTYQDYGHGYGVYQQRPRPRNNLQTYPQYFPPPDQTPDVMDNFERGLEIGRKLRRR